MHINKLPHVSQIMRHSDIFEEFAKIAQERGLISKGSPEEIKRKLENNPRIDSLDISAIEALYGVRPDTPKDMEYKNNIIEDAHPNAVVVSPSYDKINGLVENLNERQNILMHIVQKTPDGHVTQRKYAEQQLLLSLVRLGNDLDNQHKDELRVLADVCLEQTASLKKKDEKIATAAAPLLIAGLVASALGAVYLQQHLNYANEGMKNNYNRLIEKIDAMISSNADWGFGEKYTSDFVNSLNDFKRKLLAIQNNYDKIVPIINNIRKARTGSELMQMVKSPDNEIIKAYEVYKAQTNEIIPYLDQKIKDLKNQTSQAMDTEEKGFLTDLIDRTQFLHGGWGFFSNKFDDLVQAIIPYRQSILDIEELLKNAQSYENVAKQQIASAMAAGNTVTNQPEPTSTTPTNTTEPAKRSEDDVAGDLEKELSELKFAL